MLTTLARELWLDEPGPAVSEKAPPSRLTACAALGAGEPRRALVILDRIAPDPVGPELSAAIRYCAAKLDANWWPGPVGAVVSGTPPPPEPPPEASTGNARDDLLLVWLGFVIPLSLTLRTLTTGARRAGEEQGQTMLEHLLPDLLRRYQQADQAGDALAATHVALITGDICRRAGATDAMSDSYVMAHTAASLIGPAAEAACHLADGDFLVSPLQSPETIGFDLEAPNDPRVLGNDAELDEARRCYGLARAAYEQAGALRGVAAADLRLGCLELLQGRPDEAATQYDEAGVAFLAGGDGAGWALALTHRALAGIAGHHLGESRPGPESELAAWGLGTGSRSFVIGCGQLIRAAGIGFREAGEIETALAAFDLAKRLVRRLGDEGAALAVTRDCSELYAQLSSRGATIASLEEALESTLVAHGGLEAQGPLDEMVWMSAVELVASLFLELISERDPEGLDNLQQRAARLLARAPGGPRSSARGGKEDLLVRLEASKRKLAELAAARGGPLTGAPAWEEGMAAQIDLAASGIAESIAMAQVQSHVGRALRDAREGRASAAEAEFVTAIAAAESMGGMGVTMTLSALANSGRKKELQVRTEEFLSGDLRINPEFEAALWVNTGAFNEAAACLAAAGVAEPPPRERQWHRDWDPCALRARIALGCGRPGDAARLAAEGVERFEQWFAAVTSDAFRVAVLDDSTVRRPYQEVARAALALGDEAAAFEAADRVRSLGLGALIAETRDGSDADVTTAIRAWRQAKAEWSGSFDRRREAWRQLDPAVLRASADELEAAQTELDAAASALERVAPGAAGRKPSSLPAVTAADVQHCLEAGTLLVEYLLADDELLVWALTPSACRGARLDIDVLALTGAASRVHAALRGEPLAESDLETDVAFLGEALLDPVRAELDDHERVIFVPFGALHLLPFHALPFGDGLLGDDRVISQLPAASLVPRLAGSPRPRLAAGALVVGDPAADPGRGLSRLPGAAVEANAVARSLGASPLVGDDADEATVRRLLDGPSIVHLATHGLLDEVAPTLSSLVLAGRDELTVAELLGLGLEVDIAVLSACDSGRGDITLGGDIVGLARGLLAAGARHAVVSLWPVDDREGCLTMASFAERLKAGDTVARALSEARAQVRNADTAAREAWYADLADRGGSSAVSGGRRARDARPPAGGVALPPDHPMWWAPFIHIGV